MSPPTSFFILNVLPGWDPCTAIEMWAPICQFLLEDPLAFGLDYNESVDKYGANLHLNSVKISDWWT